MKVILVSEDNHGQIAIAKDYGCAVRFLLDEGWLDDGIYLSDPESENGCDRPIAEILGDEWDFRVRTEFDMDEFNEIFDGIFYLTEEEVIGTEGED